MRKKSILLILLFFVNVSTFSQWNKQNSGTTNTLSDVYFINPDTGFAVGSNTILKTVDGGLNWQTFSANNSIFQGVCFSNVTTGFAVGQDYIAGKSTIMKTTNCGVTWIPNNLTTSSILNDIFFISPMMGFIVGSNGYALKTINGGINWQVMNTGVTDILLAVNFTDTLNGIIVGGGPNSSKILKTTDGGKNWDSVISPSSEFLQGVFFPSPLLGYIVGWNGVILKTTDGGTIWKKQNSVGVYGNLDVFFVNDSVGFVVGGTSTFAGIQKTINGGLNWVAQTANVSSGVAAVFFINATIGFCVGDKGSILKTTNGATAGIDISWNSSFSVNCYPNPATEFMSISLPNNFLNKSISLIIFDLDGKMVCSLTKIEDNEIVNLSMLAQGTYIFVFKNGNESVTKQIVKV